MSRLTAPIPSHLRTSTFPHHPHPTPEPEMEPPQTVTRTHFADHRPQNVSQLSSIPSRPSSPLGFGDGAARSARRSSSTLPYTQTGIKDHRRSVNRATRWLVVVIPPPLLDASPSPSTPRGAGGRFSSGVLMPLYSTLFAQLTAVAREFGLPSTIGIYVYLQVTEAAQTIAPRLSDESWQILWTHYLSPTDESPPSSPTHGFPIAGRLEFDIDVSKAKWFHGWVNGTLRTVSAPDLQSPAPSATDGPERQNDESSHGRNTSDEGVFSNAQKTYGRGSSSVTSGSTTQVPKRLALLERRDKGSLASLDSVARSTSRFNHYALETGSASTHYTDAHLTAQKVFHQGLSPIPQAETPSSMHAQKDLNAKVQNWRNSTSNVPSAVLATSPAQPNTPPPATDETAVEEDRDTNSAPVVDLADFAWSISSRGPPSPIGEWDDSPLSSRFARSVHIADRVAGSVLLTPSTHTSWGPPSPLPTATTSSRVPTPDIAARMIEDSPCTPSTATTWGAPLSWPPTPAHYKISRVPTPDIAARAMDDFTTPPKREYKPQEEEVSTMGWPYYKARDEPVAKAENSRMGWPYLKVPATHQDQKEDNQSKMGWPYVKNSADEPEEAAALCKFGWPFNSASTSGQKVKMTKASIHSPISVMLPKLAPAYPHFDLYPAGYPHLEVYPAVSDAKPSVVAKSLSVSLPRPQAVYPVFDLYPAGYPHLVIYPALHADVSAPASLPVTVALPVPQSLYPEFNLYPAGYPHLDIYPAVKPAARKPTPKSLPVGLPTPASVYPEFNLYPAGYPSLVIYPAVTHAVPKTSPKPLPVALPAPASLYPDFNLYPAVYPSLIIYPTVSRPKQSKGAKPAEVQVRLPANAGYPVFDLYPAGYPTLEIYPKFIRETSSLSSSVRTVSWVKYPVLDIYPAVYPWIVPYPAVARAPSAPASGFGQRAVKIGQFPTRPVIRTSLPPPPQPPIRLPPLPPIPASANAPPAPVPRRSRSGTVSRSPVTPPRPAPSTLASPPSIISPSLIPETPTTRSRTELHQLIFGANGLPSQIMSPPTESPLPSSGLKSSSPATTYVERQRTLDSNPRRSLVTSTGIGRGMGVGLPSNPGMLRRSSTMGHTASMSRTNPIKLVGRGLDAVNETEDAPKYENPIGGLRRSGSLGRMKTNDDLFKQRQSLYQKRPRTSGDLSEFASPPGSSRISGSFNGVTSRPISKLDTSKYPFR